MLFDRRILPQYDIHVSDTWNTCFLPGYMYLGNLVNVCLGYLMRADDQLNDDLSTSLVRACDRNFASYAHIFLSTHQNPEEVLSM